eukprot:GHVS01107424.1.p1 GENE.GHVS01107424.1~~GHVS01107424.1.p1  ORF type:complete len:767 (+),score=71.09 GHVS01107424.1:141-2441(+)
MSTGTERSLSVPTWRPWSDWNKWRQDVELAEKRERRMRVREQTKSLDSERAQNYRRLRARLQVGQMKAQEQEDLKMYEDHLKQWETCCEEFIERRGEAERQAAHFQQLRQAEEVETAGVRSDMTQLEEARHNQAIMRQKSHMRSLSAPMEAKRKQLEAVRVVENDRAKTAIACRRKCDGGELEDTERCLGNLGNVKRSIKANQVDYSKTSFHIQRWMDIPTPHPEKIEASPHHSYPEASGATCRLSPTRTSVESSGSRENTCFLVNRLSHRRNSEDYPVSRTPMFGSRSSASLASSGLSVRSPVFGSPADSHWEETFGRSGSPSVLSDDELRMTAGGLVAPKRTRREGELERMPIDENSVAQHPTPFQATHERAPFVLPPPCSPPVVTPEAEESAQSRGKAAMDVESGERALAELDKKLKELYDAERKEKMRRCQLPSSRFRKLRTPVRHPAWVTNIQTFRSELSRVMAEDPALISLMNPGSPGGTTDRGGLSGAVSTRCAGTSVVYPPPIPPMPVTAAPRPPEVSGADRSGPRSVWQSAGHDCYSASRTCTRGEEQKSMESPQWGSGGLLSGTGFSVKQCNSSKRTTWDNASRLVESFLGESSDRLDTLETEKVYSGKNVRFAEKMYSSDHDAFKQAVKLPDTLKQRNCTLLHKRNHGREDVRSKKVERFNNKPKSKWKELDVAKEPKDSARQSDVTKPWRTRSTAQLDGSQGTGDIGPDDKAAEGRAGRSVSVKSDEKKAEILRRRRLAYAAYSLRKSRPGLKN